MGHQRGIARAQTHLLPASIEDYVPADHPIRVIDAFVESLDVGVLGFARTQPAATGRPPYHPGDLLKLFLYGYLNQVRATRRLEREAGRNLELMWLLGCLRPDFKTLANFRRANTDAIGRVCQGFTEFCRGQGLFAAQLVAIDGSKFQAVASRKQVWTPKRVAKVQARIAHKIARYLDMLARSEAEEPSYDQTSATQVRAALAELKARQQALARHAETLKQSTQNQTVVGEPEAKLMRMAHGQHAVAYTGANYRTINREYHARHAEAAAQRAADQPRLMTARKCLAEHPFGNLKWLMGVPRFLLRGIQGASIEMALAVTACNIKRVINIVSVPQLLAQLKAA